MKRTRTLADAAGDPRAARRRPAPRTRPQTRIWMAAGLLAAAALGFAASLVLGRLIPGK